MPVARWVFSSFTGGELASSVGGEGRSARRSPKWSTRSSANDDRPARCGCYILKLHLVRCLWIRLLRNRTEQLAFHGNHSGSTVSEFLSLALVEEGED